MNFYVEKVRRDQQQICSRIFKADCVSETSGTKSSNTSIIASLEEADEATTDPRRQRSRLSGFSKSHPRNPKRPPRLFWPKYLWTRMLPMKSFS